MEFAKPYLADGKGFNSRTSRQKPLKSARFDTKSDTKFGSECEVIQPGTTPKNKAVSNVRTKVKPNTGKDGSGLMGT
jgi:hypothetical protein